MNYSSSPSRRGTSRGPSVHEQCEKKPCGLLFEMVFAIFVPKTTDGENLIGGADGIRTHDLLDAIEARSQLRHGPTNSGGLLHYISLAPEAVNAAHRTHTPRTSLVLEADSHAQDLQ